MTPRSTRRSAALAAATVLLTTSCSIDGSLPGPVGVVGGAGECQQPSSERPWSEIRTEPTEFPMDPLEIAGDRTITMLSVTAVDPQGIKIDDVKFVPGDAVGPGRRYGDPRAANSPAAWTAGPVMPNARLQPLTANSTVVHGDWSHDPVWESVIGVTPTDDTGGTIAGLIYRYRVGGHVYTLRGQGWAGLTHYTECQTPDQDH